MKLCKTTTKEQNEERICTYLIKMLWLSSVLMMLRCLRQVQWAHHVIVDWLLIRVNYSWCSAEEEEKLIQLRRMKMSNGIFFPQKWYKPITALFEIIICFRGKITKIQLKIVCKNNEKKAAILNSESLLLHRYSASFFVFSTKYQVNSDGSIANQYHFFAVYPWDLLYHVQKQNLQKIWNEHQIIFYREREGERKKFGIKNDTEISLSR